MKTFAFDIMLNGRFICTLKYKYCSLFPIDFEDLIKFVLKKRPTLKGKDFKIVFQIWQDLWSVAQYTTERKVENEEIRVQSTAYCH